MPSVWRADTGIQMHARRLARALCAAGAIATFGWTAPARATNVDLGTVVTPASLVFGNDLLLGAFTDVFSFSIDAGTSFDVSSLLSTGYSNRSGILDMQASLFSGSTLLLEGDAATSRSPEGFPSRDISFAAITLGNGDYHLKVHGTATSFLPDVPITAGYLGSIDFVAATAPIPEPSTWLLMAFGLGALGLAMRRS